MRFCKSGKRLGIEPSTSRGSSYLPRRPYMRGNVKVHLKDMTAEQRREYNRLAKQKSRGQSQEGQVLRKVLREERKIENARIRKEVEAERTRLQEERKRAKLEPRRCKYCNVELTSENSPPIRWLICKSCRNERDSQEREKARIESGREKGQQVWSPFRCFVKMLKEIKFEHDKEVLSPNYLFQIKLKQIEKRERLYQSAFYGKIFQPETCIDCGVEFETLHPVVSIGAEVYCESGTKRCPKHRKQRRQSTHGGDRRRCQRAGVPYDSQINRILVLERDNWTCKICGKPTPKEKRGTYEDDAPELDHIHPILAIIDGKKSPGHVYSNVQCVCRKCNIEKNKSFKFQKEGHWEQFYQEGLKNKEVTGTWAGKRMEEPPTDIVCQFCGKPATKLRHTAKYCSYDCLRKAHNKRRNQKRKAERRIRKQELINV